MSRPIKAMAGQNEVEAAIVEGKILPSRRAHYLALMAKNPERTRKLLARLEPVCIDGYEPELADGTPREPGSAPMRIQAARQAPSASYPRDWLRAAEVAGKATGSVTFEDATAGAAAMAPAVR